MKEKVKTGLMMVVVLTLNRQIERITNKLIELIEGSASRLQKKPSVIQAMKHKFR